MQHGLRGLGRAARAEHECLLPRPDAAVAVEQPRKAVIIGVVADQSAVSARDRVDRADLFRAVGQLAEGHDGHFIGDRDVQPVERPVAQEALQRLRLDLEQLIGIVGQQAVQPGREAVPQLAPEQSAAHQTTSE